MSKSIFESTKKKLKQLHAVEESRVKSIRRFLKNQMTALEKANFEAEMIADDLLSKEVQLYRTLIHELKSMRKTGEE